MFAYFQPFTSPALKAQFDAQMSFAIELSQKMFDGMQKVQELNMQAMNALLKESIANTQQMLATVNRSEKPATLDVPTPPVAEKIRAYQQHLQNILSETQADVARTIESHVPETVRAAEVVVSEVVQKVSEETMKAADRQKQALDKITTPMQ